MTEYQEAIRSLQSELEEAREEIKRRDKQIQTLKRTNKTHENHAEVLRKKLLDIESKRNSITLEEDPRIQELNNSLSRVNAQLEQQQKDNVRLRQSLQNLRKASEANEKAQRENSRLNEMVQRLRKENSQLNSLMSQPQKGRQAPKAQVQQLKLEIQSLRQERQKQQNQIQSLQMELKTSMQRGRNISERLENQLKQKQKKIVDYEKKIASLEKSSKSIVEQQRKSQIMEQREPIMHSELAQTINQSSKVQFYEGVPLTESLNEDHLVIPTTHEKIFSLLNIYLSRLMPDQQVKFLNLIIADSENKLERVNDFLSDFE